jgi:hypothetical protein
MRVRDAVCPKASCDEVLDELAFYVTGVCPIHGVQGAGAAIRARLDAAEALQTERDTLKDWIEHWSSAHLPVWLEEEVGAALAGEARLPAADQPSPSSAAQADTRKEKRWEQ